MARRLLLTVLVLALGLSFPFAEAKKGASAGVSLIKGAMETSKNPATYHAAGVLCLSPSCNVAKAGTTFDLAGEMTQRILSRCVGISHANLKVSWPNGTVSTIYLDVISLNGRLWTGVGSVRAGPLLSKRVVMAIWAIADPCVRPAPISGSLAIF